MKCITLTAIDRSRAERIVQHCGQRTPTECSRFLRLFTNEQNKTTITTKMTLCDTYRQTTLSNNICRLWASIADTSELVPIVHNVTPNSTLGSDTNRALT